MVTAKRIKQSGLVTYSVTRFLTSVIRYLSVAFETTILARLAKLISSAWQREESYVLSGLDDTREVDERKIWNIGGDDLVHCQQKVARTVHGANQPP